MPTNNLTPHPAFSATAARDAPPRYDRVAIALHWLLAALIIAMLALGWYMGGLPKGPERAGLFNLHKSVGTVVVLLVAFRLLWRAGHRPPGWDAGVSMLRRRFAAGGHFLLYVLMLTVPLSGFLGSILGRGIVFFGLPLPPLLGRDRVISRFFNETHELLIWGLAALAAGHVVVALWHAIVRLDGTLRRILPGRPAALGGAVR